MLITIYCLAVALILVLIISINVVKSKNQYIQVLKSVEDNKRIRVETFLMQERAELGRHFQADSCNEEVYNFVIEQQDAVILALK